MSPGAERGALLLEVLAALTIFGASALATLGLLNQLSQTERGAQEVERRLADEDRLLTAYSLLEREDLDRRLGARPVGPYLVEVQRPAPALYRITIGDSTGVDLATMVHRPEPYRGQ